MDVSSGGNVSLNTAGQLAGAGGLIAGASGATGTLTIGAANTGFTGATTVDNGTLKVGVANGLGNANTAGISVAALASSTATLDLTSLSAALGNTSTHYHE